MRKRWVLEAAFALLRNFNCDFLAALPVKPLMILT